MDPVQYLDMIEKYSTNVDNLYFGYPGIDNHCPNTNCKVLEMYTNTQRFLELTRGKYKRLLAVNQISDCRSDDQKRLFVLNQLAPLILTYEIEGVIVSDHALACIIHDSLPWVDVQTSCNTYQFNLNSYRWWNESAGVTTFNPPREILRTPQLLKQVKKLGFKIKCIVNEACLYGCPQNINHACYIANSIESGYGPPRCYFCERPQWKYRDIFKTNFILPRHLAKFDQYVDVYKIAGRSLSTQSLDVIFDAYINERNDVELQDIISSRYRRHFKQLGIHIPVGVIPDKLLTCQCAQCDSCDECEKIIAQCIKNSNVDIQKLTHQI